MSQQISWQTPEYHFKKKSGAWYIWFSIIAIAILSFALYTGDYLMFITLLLLFLVAYSIANRKPEIVRVVISGKGIQIAEKFYNFNDLKKFWFAYYPPEVKLLYIEPKKRVLPAVQINLADEDPNDIRELLLKFLPENPDGEESFSDRLMRKIGL